MSTLGKIFPDLVYCSRGEFWFLRITLMLVVVLIAALISVMLTWIEGSQFHVTNYNKYQDLPWEIHVANITLDMRRNSDSPMICKGLTPLVQQCLTLKIQKWISRSILLTEPGLCFWVLTRMARGLISLFIQ